MITVSQWGQRMLQSAKFNILEIKARAAPGGIDIRIVADLNQLIPELLVIAGYVHFIDRFDYLSVLNVHAHDPGREITRGTV